MLLDNPRFTEDPDLQSKDCFGPSTLHTVLPVNILTAIPVLFFFALDAQQLKIVRTKCKIIKSKAEF